MRRGRPIASPSRGSLRAPSASILALTAPGRLSAALADRYRLERELGSGGMATVYLAEDLKHHRKVAIKVLHPELSAVLGPDRFLKEIELTANLQHPHILPLFDSGAAEGLLFYVMPFVEGETLRSRLTREHQLPVFDAVRIAIDVAGALDYAHKRGVVHRDIKPENILLHEGRPQVADFGIALAVQQAGGARMTQTGMSLGTPQYMAPEQAMGDKHVDARADIYALGAVTYEMLLGEPPFTGPTAQAIVARIMTEAPRPLTAQRKTIPPHVDEAVLTALEKLPADRFGSAQEFADALTGDSKSGAGSRHRGPAEVRSLRRSLLAWMMMAALIGAGLGGAVVWRVKKTATGEGPSRLAILANGSSSLVNSGLARVLDISADGETVVFSANGPSSDFVALRRLDGTTVTAIPGSDGVRNMHLSPDVKFLYSPRGAPNMQRLPLSGGQWIPMPEVQATPFMTWGSDGTIWWSPDYIRGIHRVPPGSDKDETPFLASPGVAEATVQQVLPGDRLALVIAGAASNTSQPAILDLRTGTMRLLFDSPVVELRYTSGYLVYALQDNTLHAAPFDVRSGRVTGGATQIADDVSLTGSGVAQFAVSATGTVVYIPSFGRELVMVNREGVTTSLTGARLNYHSPRFSPNGRKIALDNVTQDGRDVWVYDREQGQLTRTTFDRDGHDAVWAPDGKSILYSSVRRGVFGVYRITPGATGTSDSLYANAALGYTGNLVDGGRALLTDANGTNGASGGDVVLIHLGRPNPIEPLFASTFAEGYGVPSPDDKWVAFVSDESGRPEVYLHPLSKEGTKIQISLNGGSEPVWSRDGKELFYRGFSNGKIELVSASLRLGAEPTVSKRTTLFDASDYESAQPHSNYDVAPDGKSFVMLRRSPSSHLMVIQNLPGLIRRTERSAPR
jgi:serine/threonine protein kinase